MLRRRSLSLIVLVALLLQGCAGGYDLKPTELTVSQPAAQPLIHSGVHVHPVTSLGKTEWLRPPVDQDVFRNALIETLRAANLFAEVTKVGPAPLELRTLIIHESAADPRSITVPLLVRYEIRKAGGTAVVFAANHFSQPKIPYTLATAGLTGAERHTTMVRAAIRDNFEQLLEQLSAADAMPGE